MAGGRVTARIIPRKYWDRKRVLIVRSPEGAAQLSPGREPWVTVGKILRAPKGRHTTSGIRLCRPFGASSELVPRTQGSRPGLSCAAPSGLRKHAADCTNI